MNKAEFWGKEKDSLASMAEAVVQESVIGLDFKASVEKLSGATFIKKSLVADWIAENELTGCEVKKLINNRSGVILRVLIDAQLKPDVAMLDWLQAVHMLGHRMTKYWTAEPKAIRDMPEELYVSLVSQLASKADVRDRATICYCYQILRHSLCDKEAEFVKSLGDATHAYIMRTTYGGKLEQLAIQYPAITY